MLGVHHKDGSGRNDPDNLVTLCRKCRRKIHAEAGAEPKKRDIESEKKISTPKKPEGEKKGLEKAPSKLNRHEILDKLAPAGLAQRAAFGEILSVAALLKKFTVQELAARARCPETVVMAFCEQMEKRGYLKSTGEGCSLTIGVVR